MYRGSGAAVAIFVRADAGYYRITVAGWTTAALKVSLSTVEGDSLAQFRKHLGRGARLRYSDLPKVVLYEGKRMMSRVSPQYCSSRRRMGRGHVFACAAGVAVAMALFAPATSLGQSMPTASRVGDLQIGGGFEFASSRYNSAPITLIGGAGYFTFDWRNHWGVEGDFHHARADEDNTVYERTYEAGPRLFVTRGAWTPYAKLLVGRGVYNFHDGVANIAYNLYTYGGGVDYRIARSLNVRADYELQNWVNFPLGTLHPSVVTIGVAYHFNGRGAPDYPR